MSYTHEDLILITAGKKWNKFKEVFHPVRWMAESLIGDYKEKMEILRQVDDNINLWVEGLEVAIKDMEKALKAKRIVDVYQVAHYINVNLEKIDQSIKKVNELSEEALEEFSLGEDEQRLSQSDFDKYHSDINVADDLMATAGVLDFFERKKREWVAEKLKTKKYNEWIKKIESFFQTSKKIIEQLKSNLEIVGKYRRSGDIGKYLDQMSGKNGVAALQQQFFKAYSKTYYEALEPLFKKHNVLKEDGAVSQETSSSQEEPYIPVTEGELINLPKEEVKQTPDTLLPSQPSQNQPSAEVKTPEVKKQENISLPEIPELNVPEKKQKSTSEPEPEIDLSLESPASIELISPEVPELESSSLPMENLPPVPPLELPVAERKKRTKKVTSSHGEFMDQLRVVASYGNNNLTKKFILSYAADLSKSDETRYKLIAIAEGLNE